MNSPVSAAPPDTVRLILVNRFYWPDEPATAQLLTDLAEALAAHGIDPTVIASHPGLDHISPTEIHRRVRIIRVGSSRSAGGGVARKAIDFATFHCAALWRLLLVARRGDAVVALTDPPLLGIGVWFVAALRGARLFHWVQDIYPELAIALSGNSWLRLLRPLRDLAWRRADGCVTLGSDMAAVISRAGVGAEKITIVPNWAPAGLTAFEENTVTALRAAWGLQGKFVVAYSGNLGRVHDLEPILELARALRTESHIQFLFVGGGAQRPVLEAAVAKDRLENVQFQSPQPRAQLGASLAVGDAHLVTVLPGCERYVFPSKLYGVAAAGRPVIFIGPRDCELTRLIDHHGFGAAFARSDIAGLTAAIRTLATDPAKRARLGECARRFAAATGGLVAATDRWQTLLRATQACGRQPPIVLSEPT